MRSVKKQTWDPVDRELWRETHDRVPGWVRDRVGEGVRNRVPAKLAQSVLAQLREEGPS